MTRFVLLSLALLVAAEDRPGAIAGRAAGVAAADQQATFRSATLLVGVQVTVLHGSKLVANLDAGDFAILEDGVAQQVQFFDAQTVGLDVTLLLDTSSSMTSRHAQAQKAAMDFIGGLRAADRAEVMSFNEGLQVIQPLTADRDALDRAIRSTRPSGSTALRNALYVSLKQLPAPPPRAEALRRKAVVVLSDGYDTTSMIPMEDVLAVAQNNDVNLYIVTLRPESGTRAVMNHSPTEAEYDLRRLARQTGGEAFFLEQADQLRPTFGGIARELMAKYSLAYTPADTAPDRRFRRIDVRVVSNPGYQTRARSGYTLSPFRTASTETGR